jgi:hypothetical protein
MSLAELPHIPVKSLAVGSGFSSVQTDSGQGDVPNEATAEKHRRISTKNPIRGCVGVVTRSPRYELMLLFYHIIRGLYYFTVPAVMSDSTVSKISPRLVRTPGDRRGLQGNQNGAVTEDF